MDGIFVKLCQSHFDLADDCVAVRTGKRDFGSDKIGIRVLVHAGCEDADATAVDGWTSEGFAGMKKLVCWKGINGDRISVAMRGDQRATVRRRHRV